MESGRAKMHTGQDVPSRSKFGGLSGYSNGALFGWAFDPLEASRRIDVHVYVDEEYVGSCLADQFRKRLLDAGIGDGSHSFVFRLPNLLIDGKEHFVKVLHSDRNPLEKSGRHIRFEMLASLPSKKARLTKLTDDGVISGFAYDTKDPASKLRLEVLVNDDLIETITANQYRYDFFVAGLGDGSCAYQYQVPPYLRNGTKCKIDVRDADLGVSIDNSPQWRQFEPATPGELTRGVLREAGALVGNNGFLFLCDDNNGSIEQYTGQQKLSCKHLERYQEILSNRVDFFKRIGIPYIVVVVPGKESVYSDCLPPGVTRSASGTLQDQIMFAVKQASIDIPIIDLRPELISRKAVDQMYYRNDSHWNFLGAFYAGLVIINKIRSVVPHIPSFDLSDYKFITYPSTISGDLAQKEQREFSGPNTRPCQGRIPLVADEIKKVLPPKHLQSKSFDVPSHLNISQTREAVLAGSGDPERPRAMMFRDSFAGWMAPTFSGFFNNISYIWQPSIDKFLIEKERPNIVIHQIVDRFFSRLPLA